jgi:hypothetical protein
MCKKITRYGREIFRYVEERIPKNHDDPRATPGAGVQRNFTWAFRNKSRRTVRIAVTALGGYFPKDSPQDYSTYQYVDGISGAVAIPPGEEGTITGQYIYFAPDVDKYEIFARNWGSSLKHLSQPSTWDPSQPQRAATTGFPKSRTHRSSSYSRASSASPGPPGDVLGRSQRTSVRYRGQGSIDGIRPAFCPIDGIPHPCPIDGIPVSARRAVPFRSG